MFNTSINIDQLVKLIKHKADIFLPLVNKKWQQTGLIAIGQIVKDEFTGRPGLNRISGNAARALTPVTEIRGNNVFHRWLAGGPAASYLPIHQYGGIIRAKGDGYLKFKVTNKVAYSNLKTRKTGSKKITSDWIFAKQVRIPKRLHILERFANPGELRRRMDVMEAMEEIANDKSG